MDPDDGAVNAASARLVDATGRRDGFAGAANLDAADLRRLTRHDVVDDEGNRAAGRGVAILLARQHSAAADVDRVVLSVVAETDRAVLQGAVALRGGEASEPLGCQIVDLGLGETLRASLVVRTGRATKFRHRRFASIPSSARRATTSSMGRLVLRIIMVSPACWSLSVRNSSSSPAVHPTPLTGGSGPTGTVTCGGVVGLTAAVPTAGAIGAVAPADEADVDAATPAPIST